MANLRTQLFKNNRIKVTAEISNDGNKEKITCTTFALKNKPIGSEERQGIRVEIGNSLTLVLSMEDANTLSDVLQAGWDEAQSQSFDERHPVK